MLETKDLESQYQNLYWSPCSFLPIMDLSLADPGGAASMCPPPPPNRIQFFRFHICFGQKVPMSEVGTPQMAWRPPPQTGNPGSATGFVVVARKAKYELTHIFSSSFECSG